MGYWLRCLATCIRSSGPHFHTKIEEWLATKDSLTLEEFAYLMPNPEEETKHARDFRVQVLATALENPELHKNIKAETEAMYRWMRDTIEANRHKLPEEDRGFDIRFMTLTMFNIMFVYYDLVDEDKISADDYRAMLVNQIRNSARKPTPRPRRIGYRRCQPLRCISSCTRRIKQITT
jgi:hypothetical protein